MGHDPVEPKGFHVVYCLSQADGSGDVGSACLEFVRKVGVESLLEGDRLDHFPAPLVGGHGLQQVCLAVQDPDAGGTKQLVPGEHVEVTVQASHVHTHVGDRLGAVQQHGYALGVGQLHDTLGGHDSAKSVGDVGDGHQLGAGAQHRLELVHQQLTGLVDGDHSQYGPLFLAKDLPRNDVGVVFHVGDDNFIAGAYVLLAVGLGHQVDAFCGPSGVDNLPVTGGVEEAADFAAGVLIVVGGPLAQGVDAPMHVGVVGGVVVDEGVYHALGLLRSCAVVQVDQRLPVHQLVEDGEVLTHLRRVQRRVF